jgi:hypothetical protein
MKIKVITGYVPIPGHPRSAKTYGELGDKLNGLIDVCKVRPFYDTLNNCWMTKFLDGYPVKCAPASADNKEKNTIAYHCVQHQKFEWLLRAMEEDNEPDTFVWIDYGIYSVPGMEREPIVDFLRRIKKNDLAIPGCWTRFDPRCESVGDFFPNWRFCGGVMVVPRRDIPMLHNAIKLMAAKRITQTQIITWEVNTLYRVEKENVLPIRWYQADHNPTLFTGY